jgi:tetratricopeptide (TPR) repeat protein
VLRLIREEEPPRPSTRLSTTDEMPSVAANRGTEPAKLTKLVRGELDWIVMKALEKDRNRRYESANGFAMDVQRYLADEAVLACPPSAAYRLRKFVRRHKGPVLAASLVLLALVAGSAGTTIGMVQARRSAEGERLAKEEALEDKAKALAVLDFVENRIITAARPKGKEGGLGNKVTLREAVEAALPYVDKSFSRHPLIEARLRMTLGISLAYLGDARAADQQFQAARALYLTHRGPDHPDTLQSMHSQATGYAALGRHADALKLFEETLALRKVKLGLNHPDTLLTMNNLANTYSALGRNTDALELHEETLALQQATLGPNHPHTLATMNNLANSYSDVGRSHEALKLREKTLALRKAAFGPDHPDTLPSMHNLANSYNELGRHADAVELFEQTVELRKAKLGADHPDTLKSRMCLSAAYSALGRRADALKLDQETLALQQTKLGPTHPHTLGSMNNLAIDYADLGRHADALKLREELLALTTAKFPADHPLTLEYMNSLAWVLANCPDPKYRDPQRAIDLAQKAINAAPKKQGGLWNTLGVAHYRAGNWKAAVAALEKSTALGKGGTSYDWFCLAMAQWQLGNKPEAHRWHVRAIQWMDQNHSEEPELLRFRGEAEELLQIKKSP